MSVDLHEELGRAAPEPTRELDVAAVQARAGQLRRRRTAGVAATAVLLVAVAAVGMVELREGGSPPVVGPAPSADAQPAQGAWQQAPYGQRLTLPDNAWGRSEVGSLEPTRADAWTPDVGAVLAAAGDDLFNDVDRAVGPDGALLLVPREHGDRAHVVAVTADGTQQVTDLPGQPDHTQAVWSPDGAWLALSTSSDGAATVHRLTPEGQLAASTTVTNFQPRSGHGTLQVHEGEVWIGWGGDESSAPPVSQAARVTDDGGSTIVEELTWTSDEQIGTTAPLEAIGMGLVPSRPDTLPRLGTTDDGAIRVAHQAGEAVVDVGLPGDAQHLVTLATRDADGWRLADGMMEGATQQQRYATVLLADDEGVWTTGFPAAPRAAAVHIDPDGRPWFLTVTPDGYELTDLTPPDTPTARASDAAPAGGWPTVTGPPTVTVSATEPFPWAIGLAPGQGDRWCATTVRGSTSLGDPTGQDCDQVATPAQQGTPDRFGTGGSATGPSGGLSWGLAPTDADQVEVLFTDGTRTPAELAPQTTGGGRLWGLGHRDAEILAVVAHADGLPIAGYYPRPRPPGPGPAPSPERAFGDRLRPTGVDDFTGQQQAVFDLDSDDRLFHLPLDTGDGRAVGIRHRDGHSPLMFATACSLLDSVDQPDGWHALCLEQPQDGERVRGLFIPSAAEQDSP